MNAAPAGGGAQAVGSGGVAVGVPAASTATAPAVAVVAVPLPYNRLRIEGDSEYCAPRPCLAYSAESEAAVNLQLLSGKRFLHPPLGGFRQPRNPITGQANSRDVQIELGAASASAAGPPPHTLDGLLSFERGYLAPAEGRLVATHARNLVLTSLCAPDTHPQLVGLSFALCDGASGPPDGSRDVKQGPLGAGGSSGKAISTNAESSGATEASQVEGQPSPPQGPVLSAPAAATLGGWKPTSAGEAASGKLPAAGDVAAATLAPGAGAALPMAPAESAVQKAPLRFPETVEVSVRCRQPTYGGMDRHIFSLEMGSWHAIACSPGWSIDQITFAPRLGFTSIAITNLRLAVDPDFVRHDYWRESRRWGYHHLFPKKSATKSDFLHHVNLALSECRSFVHEERLTRRLAIGWFICVSFELHLRCWDPLPREWKHRRHAVPFSLTHQDTQQTVAEAMDRLSSEMREHVSNFSDLAGVLNASDADIRFSGIAVDHPSRAALAAALARIR
jgi:hypothetical protein